MGSPVKSLGIVYRVIAYIDGFNLYFGLREAGLKRYLWLELNRLAHMLIRSDQRLLKTKYFTARISGPEDKRQRQLTYLEALGVIDPTMLEIVFGKYQYEPTRCDQCGAEYLFPKEKMTDVNIATAILRDGARDQFDTAILVSGDSDQCPTIESVHELWPEKKVIVAFPPMRYSNDLASIADASFVIGEAKFRQSQFPPCFKYNGRIYQRPPSWT